MKKGLLKKILALVSAGIIACSVGITTAFAESTSPIADPDYVEITLEEFKEQNPDYQGYPEKEKPSASTYAVSGSVEWRPIGGKYYLYYTATNTKVINDWYLENGNWYFLKPTTGEMAVGWCQVGIYWYYFNGGGVMQTDWYGISGKWYYLRTPSIPGDGKPEGSMLIGAWYLNATKGGSANRNFYFNGNGEMEDWTYPFTTSKPQNIWINRGIRYNEHQGLDVDSYWREPIKNVHNGQVLFSGYYGTKGEPSGTGYTIVMSADISKASVSDIIYIRYFHMLESPAVGKGFVNAGTTIGIVGNTGAVSPIPSSSNPQAGKHLHIDFCKELKYNSKLGSMTTLTPEECMNPAAFFPSINFQYDTTKPQKNPFGSDKN